MNGLLDCGCSSYFIAEAAKRKQERDSLVLSANTLHGQAKREEAVATEEEHLKRRLEAQEESEAERGAQV